jgi:hypothetical protein
MLIAHRQSEDSGEWCLISKYKMLFLPTPVLLRQQKQVANFIRNSDRGRTAHDQGTAHEFICKKRAKQAATGTKR